MSLGSETSWYACYEADKATPAPLPKSTVAHSGDGGNKIDSNPEIAAQSDAASPGPLNKLEPADTAGTADETHESTDAQASITINEPAVDPKFCFPDSNITIQAGESLFRVHEFKLMEFRGLEPLIEAAQKDSEGRKILKLTATAEDIRNVLTVLYSSAYAPLGFSTAILKSTLRLSTVHDHPQLRAYAIGVLGFAPLPPIERFALSRDCGVGSWMSKALDDLCWREEPLTVEEGEVLGMKQFAEVAARREGVKFERGSRVMLPANVPAPTRNMAEPISSAQSAPTATSKPTSVPGPPLFNFGWNTLASSAPAVASNPPTFSGFGFSRHTDSTAPTCATARQFSFPDGMAPVLIRGLGFQAQVPTPSNSSTRPQVIIGLTGNNHQDGKMQPSNNVTLESK